MSDLLTILQGDWIEQLRTLPDKSVHCCVTSPPYWGLRDYGIKGQLGLEKTPEEYVAKVVAGFAESRRVLRDDGTLWVNLGDSYVANASNQVPQTKDHKGSGFAGPNRDGMTGLKPKNLVGIPWRVAFALQADGWYLRSDIIWHKPNPMPESVTDRPTKSHEYIFLLSKSARYLYDAEAIKESTTESTAERARYGWNGKMVFDSNGKESFRSQPDPVKKMGDRWCPPSRNKRTVWTVATSPYSEAHFATFPPDLIKPCILAGCPFGGTVLDPFGGSGTTGMVALELGRKAILIELNPEYVKLIQQRTTVTPGLALT